MTTKTLFQVDEEGGPAFPVSLPGCGDNGWQGMTLRDWFAGQALAGITAGHIVFPEDAAREAYAAADAMLKARMEPSTHG